MWRNEVYKAMGHKKHMLIGPCTLLPYMPIYPIPPCAPQIHCPIYSRPIYQSLHFPIASYTTEGWCILRPLPYVPIVPYAPCPTGQLLHMLIAPTCSLLIQRLQFNFQARKLLRIVLHFNCILLKFKFYKTLKIYQICFTAII